MGKKGKVTWKSVEMCYERTLLYSILVLIGTPSAECRVGEQEGKSVGEWEWKLVKNGWGNVLQRNAILY